MKCGEINIKGAKDLYHTDEDGNIYKVQYMHCGDKLGNVPMIYKVISTDIYGPCAFAELRPHEIWMLLQTNLEEITVDEITLLPTQQQQLEMERADLGKKDW